MLPRGVDIFNTVMRKWNYDLDPYVELRYAMYLEELKNEIEKNGQRFLVDLMTSRLVDNSHTLTLELFPDPTLADIYRNMEGEYLTNLEVALTKQQGLASLRETSELLRIQEERNSPQDLASIPRLKVEHLTTTNDEIPLRVDKDVFDSGVTVLEHKLNYTNGIAYVDFAIDISTIDFDDVELLPLFSTLLAEAGNPTSNDVEFQREVDSSVGGLMVDPMIEDIYPSSDDNGYYVPTGTHLITKLVIRASCIAKKNSLALFTIFHAILFKSDLRNQKKAIQILRASIDDLEDFIQVNGYEYTTYRISARYSLPGFVTEQLKGVTQLFQLRKTLYDAENDWDTLADRMEIMRERMTRSSRTGMFISLSGDEEVITDMTDAVRVFVTDLLPQNIVGTPSLPDFGKVPHPWAIKGIQQMEESIDEGEPNEAFIAATRVNHVGKGGELFDVGERIDGSDEVVTKYISGFFLYNALIFSGGSAEARAVLDLDSGVLIYQSDRDPNLVATLAIYDEASSFLYNEIGGSDQLPVEAEAAIVGVIGSLDGTALQPDHVGQISLLRYFKQNTPEKRREWRRSILDTVKGDFSKMSDRLGAWGMTSISVVTNEYYFQEAHREGLNMTSCDFVGYTCD
jgi:Zn-dependent M16 (insulinase) family peptidase